MKLCEITNILKRLYEEEERVSYRTVGKTGFKALPYVYDSKNPIIDSFLSDEETYDRHNIPTTLARENMERAEKILKDTSYEFPRNIDSDNISEEKLQRILAALIFYNSILKDMGNNYFERLENLSGYSSAINKEKTNLNGSLGLFYEFMKIAKPKKAKPPKEEETEEIENKETENKEGENKASEQQPQASTLTSTDNKPENTDSSGIPEDWLKYNKYLPKADDIDEDDDDVKAIRKIELNIEKTKIKIGECKELLAVYDEGSVEKEETKKELEKAEKSLQNFIIKHKKKIKEFKKE